jgi:soluble lytic murein transglycosylase-like protein
VEVESTYNPKARGAVGEVGLMQLRPATARMVGYSGSMSALYDPETNIAYGMKYLGEAHKLAAGDTCGTILRYNAGHGATRMNPISAAYCEKVRKKLRNP